jgi:hypothetical protein
VGRLYFPKNNPAPAPFAYGAALVGGFWETTRSGLVTQQIVHTKAGSGFAEGLVTADAIDVNPAGTGTNPNDYLLCQYVTPPLAAQTLSATQSFRGPFRVGEGDTNMNARSQIVVYLVGSDGAHKSTLYAGDADGTGNEWVVLGTRTTRRFPRTTQNFTSVACADEDRVVIELGARIHGTAANLLSIIVGLDAGAGDHADSETATGGQNPWIDFAQSFTWYTGPAPGGARSSVVAVAG